MNGICQSGQSFFPFCPRWVDAPKSWSLPAQPQSSLTAGGTASQVGTPRAVDSTTFSSQVAQPHNFISTSRNGVVLITESLTPEELLRIREAAILARQQDEERQEITGMENEEVIELPDFESNVEVIRVDGAVQRTPSGVVSSGPERWICDGPLQQPHDDNVVSQGFHSLVGEGARTCLSQKEKLGENTGENRALRANGDTGNAFWRLDSCPCNNPASSSKSPEAVAIRMGPTFSKGRDAEMGPINDIGNGMWAKQGQRAENEASPRPFKEQSIIQQPSSSNTSTSDFPEDLFMEVDEGLMLHTEALRKSLQRTVQVVHASGPGCPSEGTLPANGQAKANPASLPDPLPKCQVSFPRPPTNPAPRTYHTGHFAFLKKSKKDANQVRVSL